MNRVWSLLLILVCVVGAIGAQAEITKVDAGEYFKKESEKPAEMFNDPPSLAEPGWESARCATLQYKENLPVDLYWPANSSNANIPFVVTVFSYDTQTFIKNTGKPFRLLSPTIMWMSQIANRGFISVCPDVKYPGVDIEALFAWLGTNGTALGGDPKKIGILAFSANAQVIPYLLSTQATSSIRSIVMYYPDLLLKGFTPASDVAVQIVKAGRDNPSRNQRIDTLTQSLTAAGNVVELYTYAAGVHSFDLKDRSPEAAAAMTSSLDFLTAHLK